MEFNFDSFKSQVVDLIRRGIDQDDVTELEQACDVSQYQGKTVIEAEMKQCLDTAFRQILIENPDLDLDGFSKLLNFSIATSRKEMTTGNLPVILLMDLFDCRTLDDCERLFVLVEERVDVWKEEPFFKQVKNHLLRACNDLLKRLSRSQNTVFCGRILVFLARFFPLFERSGLNLISEFNHENITAFSVEEEGILLESMIAKESSNLEDGEIKNQREMNQPQVDYNFYRKFWQLQEFFRSPLTCYNRTNWKKFQTYSNDVLDLFGSYKLDPTSCANFQDLGLNSEEYMYFAKYLTNQRLLHLQLSDSNFRRYILVQFLIVFQYLTNPIRFKQDNQVLTEEQNNWIKETMEKIYTLFEQTPPNGKEFRQCVEKILKREEFWSSWKNEGCPDLKQVNETCNIKATYTKKRKLGDEFKLSKERNRILIGNNQSKLNEIWNLYAADNWEACRSKKRVFTPTIEKFFENAFTCTPEQREKVCADSNFSWKALRLLSQKSQHFFTPSNQMVKPVSSYLESVIDKLSKDFTFPIQKNTNDLAIDDTEDISDDELLKNIEDSTVGSVATTPIANHGFDVETPNGINGGISNAMVEEIAEKIKSHWEKLAPHLKIMEDEIKWISDNDEFSSPEKKAKHVLTMWMENQDPEESTIANLQLLINKAEIQINISNSE